jgi:hypothetical protein
VPRGRRSASTRRTTAPARPLTDPDGKPLHTLIVKVNLDVPNELLKPRGHVEVDVVLGAEHVSDSRSPRYRRR